LLLSITDRVIKPGDVVIGWDDVANAKPWAGKNFATLGDSIEQSSAAGGYDYMQTEVTHFLRANPAYFGGVSGRTMRQLLNGVAPNGGIGSRSPATAADFATVDLVKIAAGTNDFGIADGGVFSRARPLGRLGDTGTANTFFGDMHHIVCESLLTWNPRARIAMTTPLQRFDNGADGNPVNALGSHLSDYADAIIAFCDHHALACLDLHRKSGINAYTAHTYLVDGLHPNPLGYQELLVPQVWRFLESIR
jgi:lysophospholipase L1-like esterase